MTNPIICLLVIFGAAIPDEVYLKSSRTLSPAQILMVPAQTARDVFGRNAAFARAIANELADPAIATSFGRSRTRSCSPVRSVWPLEF